MKIFDYNTFFDLRDKYPECTTIISAIMDYAFTHDDTIDEKFLYLGEYKTNYFDEHIKLIFKELGFDEIVCISQFPKSRPHLIVKVIKK